MSTHRNTSSSQSTSSDQEQWDEWNNELDGPESIESIPLRFWHHMDARAALIQEAREGRDIDTYPELNSREPVLWIRQQRPDIEARFSIEQYEADYQHILAHAPKPLQYGVEERDI